MKVRFDPLRPLYTLSGIIGLVLKRQRHNLGLTLLALFGIILTVGLVTNASFFSQAVDKVILLQELGDFSRVTGRPSFSTSAYVFPSRRSPITLENAEQLSRHVAETLSTEVGLPLRHVGLEVSSGSMMLRPGAESALYAEDQGFLEDVEVVYIADVAERMEIVEGNPLDEGGASSGVLDVWMHERLAREMGAHTGETLEIDTGLAGNSLSVRLVGFWRAKDAQDEFWFGDPDAALDGALLVRRQDYIAFIQPILASGSRKVDWYIILDERRIIPRDSASYLAGFRRGLHIIDQYLPGVQLNTPPLDPLGNFVQRSTILTILLLGFNLPAFGILLYFLVMVSAIIAQWQRKETSVFVSRGMSVAGVLSLTLVEQVLLFVVGYPLGIAFGMLIARLMGYAASFLSFTYRPPLPVSFQGLNVPLTVLALAVSLLARLWPAIQAAHQSVVAEERERARPSQRPFWYRYYLDFLLLLPTAYAYRQFAQRGSLAGLLIERPEDLYRDPLLILVPTLFILTASLLTMRLFPFVMLAIDAIAGGTPWLTFHLTLRQLGRQTQDYIKPLLLVIISLALGVYTLSMATSLDQWLVDRVYYRVGADLTFTPLPLVEGTEFVGGDWIPAPADFDRVEGVAAATAVGDFPAIIHLDTGEEFGGRFLAIDRTSFPSVAWFRSDFADESLGALMNRLAVTSDGVLVSRDFLARSGLRIGDGLSAQVSMDEENLLVVTADLTIAGTYDYFPTVYEEEEAVTVIGNIDHLSALLGITMPHDIWMRLEPAADGEAVLRAIPGTLAISTDAAYDARAILAEERARMERVGVFGTLTIGFLAATTMAVLGLLIYSYASLRERVYRLAVLHAIGISRRHVVTQVIMEYSFLAVFGTLTGVFIGMFASELLIPFFRFTGEQGMPLPPLLPIIARQQVANLAIIVTLIVVSAEVATIASTLYRRVLAMLKSPFL
jgi:putative ABC transport system permease protein